MIFGSLFSGIGGLDLGLERAGMTCAWQVENNEFCQAVLGFRFPDSRVHPDVRTFSPHVAVDLICGGFPCQDVSSAGKRAGLDGERSGLWTEYRRILEEARPRFVLVENVARLRTAGLDRVLQDLAALGYDAEWDCLPAASVGAPHLRDRLFLVAWDRSRVRLPDTNDGAQGPLADSGRNGREVVGSGECDHGCDASGDLVDGCSARIFCPGALARWRARCEAEVWPRAQPGLGRASDGLAGGLDLWERGVARAIRSPERGSDASAIRQARLMAIGNAVVPQLTEFVGRRILEVFKP